MGLSSTGVRQGDPLGPMLFCLGIHSSLIKIKQLIHNESSSTSLYAGVMAYMDDIFVWAPDQNSRVLANNKFTQIKKILSDIGLQVNVNKTLMLTRSNVLSASRMQITMRTDGIKLLGVPIGTNQYRINQVQ